MGWQIDKRGRNGGYWECREKRRKYNAHRLEVAGTKFYIPDQQTREFALHLREARKEATRGRT